MADAPFPSSKFDTFLGENPYDVSNPRHALWTKASRFAAEGWTQIRSDVLEKPPREVALVYPWLFDSFYVPQFDLMARHLMAFMVADQGYAGAEVFDGFLQQFCDGLVTYFTTTDRPRWLANLRDAGWTQKHLDVLSNQTDASLEFALRSRLMKPLEHWKKQAMRMAREHEYGKRAATQASDTPVAEIKPPEPAEEGPAAGSVPDRGSLAEWLTRLLFERGWTPKDLENKKGPTEKTTRRIQAGGTGVEKSTREKLARAFKVPLSEVPER